MREVTLSLTASPTEEGFSILAITAGEAAGHGIRFSAEVLRGALALYEGLPVFIDHPAVDQGPSIRNLAGTLHSPAWNEVHQGIEAQLQPTGPACNVLMALREAALANPAILRAVGFSCVLRVQLDREGNVTKIASVRSVDAVIEPARGGRFLAAAPSAENSSNLKGDRNMEEVIEKAAGEEAQSRRVLLSMCANLLKTGLAASRLPAASQAVIEKQFAGSVFEPLELQAAIDGKREELAGVLSGQVVQGPARLASAMFNSADQLQAAVDDLLGAPRDADQRGLKAARLSGIREAYLLTTGDRDFTGGYFPEFALAGTSTFPVLVKNALNKRLAEAWERYGAAGYDWWSKIVTVEHFSVLDQIDWTILGTIGALPTIDEAAAYTELKIGDNGETSDWTKYGGYVGLTLEAILRDNVRAFKRLPDEVALGGMRNISEQVAAIFTASSGAGPTLSDTGALFNATAVTTKGGHANLLTTALGTDLAAWRAAETAMFKQPMHVANEATFYGTGKAQAVRPKYCLVPQDLKGAADDLFLKSWTSNGENLGHGYVMPLVVPEWTDSTDWAAVADPNILPGIMLGEIFGLKPQVFLAGSETDPAMFANDESRLKVRQFLTVGIGNWRALHKNNVAG